MLGGQSALPSISETESANLSLHLIPRAGGLRQRLVNDFIHNGSVKRIYVQADALAVRGTVEEQLPLLTN